MFHPGEFELRTYVIANLTPIDAVALAALVWPDFREYRGGVFLRLGFDEAGVDAWFLSDGATVSSVESMVNHFHLWEAFSARSDEDRGALTSVGLVMRETWAAALASRFPSRVFEVVFSDDPVEYGPTVTFFSSEG
ncbi:hypothetical protein [Kribbella italica]|uniref:Uncharacterized protein n=1 Tax=Kribbella italica TaxID=1540520 RepID=A0A7W9JAI7_9ACTN|nr:hypothetical protein [Kribbella italica]MBB5838385.1 hypothetical protein [Kribbella italica]